MKSFFRFVLLTLVLLVVALVSALTAMRFAIHGREVAVPNLVGKSPFEARKLAEAAGLFVEIERQYYSPSMPDGLILSQVPLAGTPVRRGWEIRVAQSLGPQRVQIPNVIGESERAAGLNIRRRGLDVGAMAEMAMTGVTADQVLAQSPPPNASNVSAPKISLLMSEPPMAQAFVMPGFVGQSLSSVTAALQAAGVRVGSVTVASPPETPAAAIPSNPTPEVPPAPTSPPPPPSPASIVVSQLPAAGSKILAGSTVTLQVR